MADSEYEITDVIICGCGPSGAMLTAYLGQMSIPHIVIEKEAEITTDPRGIALDEDGIRMLQGIGIYDHIYSDIGTCENIPGREVVWYPLLNERSGMRIFKFIGGTDKVLDRKAFLEMDYGTTSSTITDIYEEGDHVYSRYLDAQGNIHQVKSRFLVGADGKTGFTRKNFLEPLGIRMEQAHESFYDETWVALNWEISLPTEKTHPEFSLWKLGYTPQQVYDVFFPENFRFICNPERPAVCGRFGLPSDRLWRFEFVVRAGEDGEQMSKSENIQKVAYPYITHSGTRYGLTQDVQFPEDCIRVLRSRPFRFSARSCNKWSLGRVVLCGDAAHVFRLVIGGQGIASGFRDAVSLAWRLVVLCRQKFSTKPSNHEEVLKGWYIERKQQLERSLASTIENGKFVTEGNPVNIFLRDWSLFFMHFVPSWRRDLRLGRRKEGPVKYQYSPGLPFDPRYVGGICLPQVYVKLADGSSDIFFSDDIIFGQRKKGLFQLLISLESMDRWSAAREAVSRVEELSEGEIHAAEATFLIQSVAIDSKAVVTEAPPPVYCLATGEEFAGSSLCIGRPKPEYYDPLYLSRALKGNMFVLIRPDRFIYAACNEAAQLEESVSQAVAYLRG
ncbi:hypothetical protein N7486_003571 [Penicillium sp. IBT 16267x]|nr:hypothetical protein N7486_003571 [Penicillium sp. IBT 16267x]